jgi:hypothetical protein
MNEFRHLKDADAINRYAACLHEGDIIPLNIEVESDVLDIAQDQVDLILKHETYFRIALPPDISQQELEKIMTLDQEKMMQLTLDEKKTLFDGIMIYISPDATRWAPLNDARAVQEVFGLQGGVVGLSVAMSETEGVQALFSFKTD